MSKGIGVSGMGRIGRLVIRKIFASGNIVNLKAINAVYPAETVAHLLKFDSVHGRWDADISVQNDVIIINGPPVQMT
jgi:glyceraldehyde 3-phosphate dehydrogenase